ncbi:hypothetical protein CPC16_000728 [Podila verticillata]|nr:hypothetical protein BGZ52_013124 [Haplosporangium bisporale]KAF9205830.1 hypothetical protein BGZ59_000263 [Podila verticillata]KAF9375446.1 hypothetical protein CPC16_000728 [Podila verticillata]KFH64057.1 hypothetical protein MVEG_09882 [Podila verticillata NRRL 6337]
MSRPKFSGTSSGRRETEGTFYRDIAFVPSGTLALKQSADANTESLQSTKRIQDAADVRAFYKSVLAMPRSVSMKNKKPKVRSSSVQQEPSKESAKSSSSSSVSQSPGSSPVQTPGAKKRAPGNIGKTVMAKDFHRNWLSSHVQADQEPVDGSVFCEACLIQVQIKDLERHNQGTAHLVSQESTVKPLDTLTLGHSNKGFRMLVNSGWDYEKGLGADGKGTRHPIATRLKHDRLALGAEKTKKVVTHTFEEIEKSRAKPTAKSNRRVPLSAEDYRRKAEKERLDRINLMAYMKT